DVRRGFDPVAFHFCAAIVRRFSFFRGVSMFQAIEALVRSTGKIVLSLAMDGDKMMVFLTPQGDTKDAVLRQPLILSATPAELDEGFAAAVQSYSTAHKSLDEQVAATTAILQSAEK